MKTKVLLGLLGLMAWFFLTGEYSYSSDIQFEMATNFSDQTRNLDSLISSTRGNNHVRSVSYDEGTVIDNVNEPVCGIPVRPAVPRGRSEVIIDNAMPQEVRSKAKLAHSQGKFLLSFGIGGYSEAVSYDGERSHTVSSNYLVSASLGYHAADNLEIGFSLASSSVGSNSDSGWLMVDDYTYARILTFEATVIDAQVFLRYYFTNESRLVPYLGLGIGGSSYRQNIMGTIFSQGVVTCSGMFGLELMFNQSASMFFQADLMATSEDDLHESFLRAQGLVGLSFHF
jgi:hypothetical protein